MLPFDPKLFDVPLEGPVRTPPPEPQPDETEPDEAPVIPPWERAITVTIIEPFPGRPLLAYAPVALLGEVRDPEVAEAFAPIWSSPDGIVDPTARTLMPISPGMLTLKARWEHAEVEAHYPVAAPILHRVEAAAEPAGGLVLLADPNTGEV